MKYLLYAFTAVAIFTSCGTHTKDCPTLRDLSWIVYNNNDTIRFTNANHSEISFVVNIKGQSASYTEDCEKESGNTYYCKPCYANAGATGNSDSSRNQKFQISISTGNTDGGPNEGIYYVILDGFGSFSINGTSTIVPNQYMTGQMYNTLTLGGTTYTDVYAGQQDTLTSPGVMVWKSYYNKQYGILGFEDRQTHTLFYRE